ncbi:MAG: hypothetical protein IRY97_12265 [Thermomicrobiaceae bacterium]|nr:hypothetical protein [Thermomicrobiaceae bacterium]
MHEVCFCGWSGEVADRELIYVGDGELALACPDCGRLDRLRWLPDHARQEVLEEAARRRAMRARQRASTPMSERV